jgi:hypothetical protein
MNRNEQAQAPKRILSLETLHQNVRFIGTDSGGVYMEARNAYGEIVVYVMSKDEAIELMEFLSEATL